MAQRHIARGHRPLDKVEDIRAAPCWGLFPLPSPFRRANHSFRGEQSRPLGFPLRDARYFLSLRERIKVRGNDANNLPRIGPFPELSNWTSAPLEPEVS